MLNINKEFLRELIKENLYYAFGRNDTTDLNFNSDSRDFITYSTITKIVSGNSCWEDSTETISYTDAHYINESTIGEMINQFIIKEHEFDRYNINKSNIHLLCEYYDNFFITDYNFHKFVDVDYEENERDYYGNHNVSRIMTINMEGILNYILNNPYSKPIEELSENLTELSSSDIERIKNTPFIMKSILNDELIVGIDKNSKKIKV